MVIDAGAESNLHYASDFTRTYPTSGKFTSKQRDVYQIVADCNELAFSLTRPGITYREVHLATARKMLEGLAGLGLVRGDLDEMTALGIAGLFQPQQHICARSQSDRNHSREGTAVSQLQDVVVLRHNSNLL